MALKQASPDPSVEWAKKPFVKELIVLVESGTPVIWLQTFEPDQCDSTLAAIASASGYDLYTWNCVTGMRPLVNGDHAAMVEADSKSPLQALNLVWSLSRGGAGRTLVSLRNFDRYLIGQGAGVQKDAGAIELLQMVENLIPWLKSSEVTLIIQTPLDSVPDRLTRRVRVLEQDLPTRSELLDLMSAASEGNLPADADLIVDAASGLTLEEAESAFYQSIAESGVITPSRVWDLKAAAIKRSGILEVYRADLGFESIGGFERIKNFCKTSVLRSGKLPPDQKPKGVLLLGIPGTGKSAFAKALGKETNRPTLILDFGRVMAGVVGASESNLRQALKMADRMAPVILFIDELEKALAGVGSGGQYDSGVSSRLFGSFLTWLNDHESDVYTVATANSIDRLPPEFARAERFDGVFFADVPIATERKVIWEMYLKKFGLDSDQQLPNDDSWTGAEIRSCCRLAALHGISLLEAASAVVPIAIANKAQLESLRNAANGRFLSASLPGVYTTAKHGLAQVNASKAVAPRKVKPPGSSNGLAF